MAYRVKVWEDNTITVEYQVEGDDQVVLLVDRGPVPEAETPKQAARHVIKRHRLESQTPAVKAEHEFTDAEVDGWAEAEAEPLMNDPS